MNAARPFVDRTMTTWDGATLSYRAWLPAVPVDKALLLLHRGHEHAARWQTVVDALAFDDVAIFAWDARGHGRSSGERGAAENVAALVKDLDVFASHITKNYGVAADNMIVIWIFPPSGHLCRRTFARIRVLLPDVTIGIVMQAGGIWRGRCSARCSWTAATRADNRIVRRPSRWRGGMSSGLLERSRRARR
jgi:hypothetical protein